ncbi:MAG: bifunctional hydroxymethylpyrimidine kinase/phosphomethylpyrimidine kinase, partial [Candidatus Odinarchaeia archaeon]
MMYNALTIAGSDPSSGAGIIADLKTFEALGVYGFNVITAVTAQNAAKFSDILKVDDKIFREQIKSVLEYHTIQSIKTGLLVSATQ